MDDGYVHTEITQIYSNVQFIISVWLIFTNVYGLKSLTEASIVSWRLDLNCGLWLRGHMVCMLIHANLIRRAVTISDFHCMIIVAERIYDNKIIAISIENLKQKDIRQIVFNLFIVSFWQMNCKCRELERESVTITVQKNRKSTITLNE